MLQLGRLDQHLIGFYWDEVAAGNLDEERALEYLGVLLGQHQPACAPKVGTTLLESGTLHGFCEHQHRRADGRWKRWVNEVSYLLLKTIEQMHILAAPPPTSSSPQEPGRFSGGRRCHPGGWGQPSVSTPTRWCRSCCAKARIIVDARCGGTSGCVEAGALARRPTILTGYSPTCPKCWRSPPNDGSDPISGKQLEPHTGKGGDIRGL